MLTLTSEIVGADHRLPRCFEWRCGGRENVARVGRGQPRQARWERQKTQLSFADMCGHEEVVKIPLGREDVNSDKPDNCSRTPLSLTAWCGPKQVVIILLMREEVNPNKPDNVHQTPLYHTSGFEQLLGG